MKTYTKEQTEQELRKMNNTEAMAYYRICKMNTKCIQTEADRRQNEMHFSIMQKIVNERGIA